jgi:hypothetical protein
VKLNDGKQSYYGWIGFEIVSRDLTGTINPSNPTEAVTPDPTVKEIRITDWALQMVHDKSLRAGQKE